MKKTLSLIFALVLASVGLAQQYNVTATPAGIIKPLPNGAAVKAPAGGTTGQVLWNNAGTVDGFTSIGDVTVVPSTGVTTISAGAVTNAKTATMPQMTIKGNALSSSGPQADLSSTQAKSILAITTADVSGLGSIASQNSNAVNISGGIISGANVTGLAPPVLGTDAVNKDYVSSISAGITPRTGVAVATTANVTLSGEQTIDGVITSASRILVKNQTSTLENGIYVTAAGAWARASDSNTAAQLKFGYYYFVSSGTTQSATSWFIATAPVVLNTDPVLFSQFSASQSYLPGNGLNLGGNTFSVASAQNGLVISSSTFAGSFVGNVSGTGTITSTGLGLFQSNGGIITGISNDGSNGLIGTNTNHPLRVLVNTSPIGTFSSTGLAVTGAISATSGKFTGASTPTANSLIADFVAGSRLIAVGANPATQGTLGIYTLSSDASMASLPALFSSTGLAVTGAISSTGAAAFGAISSNSAANARTTKGNFNLTINVKDYGALGNNVNDDTVAIAAAITALPASSGGTLYFPAGVYRTSAIAFANLSNIAIKGDGQFATVLKSITAGNVIYFRPSCSNISMSDLTVDNNNSARAAGQHGIVIGCSKFTLSNVAVTRCGEYAVLTGWDQQAGVAAAVTDIIASNILVYNTYADGFHFKTTTRGTLTNSIFTTDDDCIAVDASSHITVSNCVGTARNDLGTTWGRGIAVFTGSTDVIISGCEISSIKQHGLVVEKAGGSPPARVSFSNCRVYNCGLISGDNAHVEDGIDIMFEGGSNRNAFGGNHLTVYSGTRIVVKGVSFGSTVNAYARGITTGDTTSTETIDGFYIINNTFAFQLTSQNEAVRLAKGISGTYYSNVLLTGNSGVMDSTDYLIFTRNMAASSKVYSNTAIGAASCYFHDTGGGGSTPANGNNF